MLGANPEIGRDSLCSQLEMLVIDPFKTTRTPTLIIIDALDECKDEEPASAILSVLSRYSLTRSQWSNSLSLAGQNPGSGQDSDWSYYDPSWKS